jgi:hypothetical protein
MRGGWGDFGESLLQTSQRNCDRDIVKFKFLIRCSYANFWDFFGITNALDAENFRAEKYLRIIQSLFSHAL